MIPIFLRRFVERRWYNREYWETHGKRSGYSPRSYHRHDYLSDAIAETYTSSIKEFDETLLNEKWLEAGCAKGFMVEGLVDRNIDAYGFDISKYAVKHSPSNIRQRLNQSDGFNHSLYSHDGFSVIISMETMEHIHEDDVDLWISNIYTWLRKGGYFIATICLGNDNKRGYDDIDKSHRTLQPREWWSDKLYDANFYHSIDCERLSNIITSKEVQTDRMTEPENLFSIYKWHLFVYTK